MKLKGLKYYILGLISLPIFLTSFASADTGITYNLGEPSPIYNLGGDGTIFTFINGANFNINATYKVFQYKAILYGTEQHILTLFWNNGGLYAYMERITNGTYKNQGFLQYYVEKDYIPDVGLIGSNFDTLKQDISTFTNNSNYSNPNSFTYYPSNPFTFCFNYDNLGKSICFLLNFSHSDWYSLFTGSLGILDSPLVGEYDGTTEIVNYFQNSPFSSSSSDICIGSGCNFGYDTGDSQVIIWSGHTKLNKNYIDLFHTIGFYSGLCYSDFYLNNKVNSGTNFNDFFITDLDDSESFTGATVFDLWPNWFTSNLNFATYFSNANAVYKTVYNNNDRLSIYNGLSKGQFRLFFKLNNAEFIDTYTLNSSDVYCFCNMVINGYDPNGIFTCSTSISFDNIKSNSDYIQENGTDFVLSGANDSGLFSGGSDLLDVFNKLYSRFKQAFPIDESLSSNTVGILPAYVILGFFMFLLLYILKR